MKIAIFGGTGAVGSRVVAEAVRRGHAVTALSRRRPTQPLPDGAAWQQGDAADPAAVAKAAAANDVVVAAHGPTREPGGNRAAYVDTIRTLAGNVGATRLVVVGGAGSLLVAPGVRLLDTPDFPAAYKAEALVGADALAALRSSGPEVDWTYLSPAPELTPGERTGTYRVGDDSPVGESISYDDYAVALVDELERPAHRRTRFTVAH